MKSLHIHLFVFLTSILMSPVSSCSTQSEFEALPEFLVDKEFITVSGISAGGAFATQFHIAFSSVINGCGTWAGVPYLCYTQRFLGCMTLPSIIRTGEYSNVITDIEVPLINSSVDELITDTNNMWLNGHIDDPENLADDRIYAFHGTDDIIVFPAASEKIQDFYQHYIKDPANMTLNTDIPASHAVVSDHTGTTCGDSDHRLNIENCNFDSVFNLLNFIHGGTLNPPVSPGESTGRLAQFGQDEFFARGSAYDASMESYGYFYVPQSCEPGTGIKCKLHVFFHGCRMQPERIGSEFIEKAGFLEVADSNNMIIIFPSTIARALIANPLGCFNWSGYLGDLLFNKFGRKEALQMSGVFNMVARAAGLTPM